MTQKEQQYIALYRRWRPQTFGEAVGQEHVTRTLQNALRMGRVAHAYLFCGLRGTGKTSMAKLLAKSINCLEPAPEGYAFPVEPCNKCLSCQDINRGRSMDVLEIDAASNRGIDEIRDLREKVRFAPAQSRYKVYIIDEVHMLTNEAFNALLKTLEEPPGKVIFILATTEASRLPATVISRCQRFDFRLLEAKEISDRLQEVAGRMGFSIGKDGLSLLPIWLKGRCGTPWGSWNNVPLMLTELSERNRSSLSLVLLLPSISISLWRRCTKKTWPRALPLLKTLFTAARNRGNF